MERRVHVYSFHEKGKRREEAGKKANIRPESIWYQQQGDTPSFSDQPGIGVGLIQNYLNTEPEPRATVQLAIGVEVKRSLWFWKKLSFLICIYLK